MNKIMAVSASSVLSCIRFPGSSDFNIQKLINVLVPYRRMHYAYPSYAPFLSKFDKQDHNYSLRDIVKSVIDEDNNLGYCDPKIATDPDIRNISLSTCFQFRGEVEPSEVVQCLDSIYPNLKFPTDIPRGMNSTIINEPCIDFEDILAPKTAVHMLDVSGRVYDNFQMIWDEFDRTYRTRAYAHCLVGEGLEEGEIIDSREHMAATTKDYESVSLRYYNYWESNGEGEEE